VQELSSDGKTALVGWSNGVVTLQDPRTDEPRRIINAYEGSVENVALSPDGTLLATAGLVRITSQTDTTVDASINGVPHRLELKVWDVKTTKLLSTLPRGEGEVKWVFSNKIAFSPDSQTLATFGYYTPVRLWEARSGRLLRTLPEQFPTTTDYVTFPSNGNLLAVGGNRAEWSEDKKTLLQPIGEVRLYNLQNGQLNHLLTHTEPELGNSIGALSFSPDGALLAAGVATGKHQKINEISSQFNIAHGEVWLWDTRSGKRLSTLRRHRGLVNSLAFSPDGKQIASGSSDETVHLWDVSTGKLRRVLTMYGTHQREETVETRSGPPGTKIEKTITESSDGRTTTGTSTIKNGTQEPGTSVTRHVKLSVKEKGVRSLHFAPDNHTLLVLDENTRLKLWDTRAPLAEDRSPVRRVLARHDDRVSSLALSPDGNLLVTGGNSAVRLWDTATEQEQRILATYKGGGSAVAIANNGMAAGARHLYTWQGTGAYTEEGRVTGSEVTLWDVRTGKTLRTLAPSEAAISAMAFSPNGRLLASGGVIYGADTPASAGRITGFGVNPQPRQFGISVGGDQPAPPPQQIFGEVTLWDVPTRKPKHNVRVPGARVTAVVFSPDGKFLATEHEELGVRLWNVETGELLHAIDTPRLCHPALSQPVSALAIPTLPPPWPLHPMGRAWLA
jgi:WD40 repeat protein